MNNDEWRNGLGGLISHAHIAFMFYVHLKNTFHRQNIVIDEVTPHLSTHKKSRCCKFKNPLSVVGNFYGEFTKL